MTSLEMLASTFQVIGVASVVFWVVVIWTILRGGSPGAE